MKVELEQHYGVGFDGIEVAIGQWHVVVDGVRCGYLPKDEGANILPTIPMMGFSLEDQTAIADQCSKLLGREVGKAIPFYVPPPEQDILEEDEDEG